MDEFEVMRRQLAAMKKQLDTQQIVNKQLMGKVMRNKASWLNLFVTAELIALPFIYLFIVGICYGSGISQWYSFAFLVFGGIDALLDIRTVRIPTKLFSASSILELRKFLVRQKKERFIQTCVSSGLCIAWALMLIRAMVLSGRSPFSCDDISGTANSIIIIGTIIGTILGITFVLVLYRKMQDTNDRILEDIGQLEDEEYPVE